jgi:hypothetical protein
MPVGDTTGILDTVSNYVADVIAEEDRQRETHADDVDMTSHADASIVKVTYTLTVSI